MIKRMLGIAALVGLAQLLGCATTRPSCKVPDTVKLELESSDRLNQDERGRSLPTLVRIYQLTGLSKLQQAAFDDISERDSATLGATLVSSDELTVYPGQVAVKRIKRDPKADYVVAAAVFRAPIGGAWRTVQEWPLTGDPCGEHNDAHAGVKLEQLRLRLFLENYRIESVNNYVDLPKRHCSPGKRACSGGLAPDELPEERRDLRLKTFEEDSAGPNGSGVDEEEER